MKLLAFDTSSETLSVALFDGDKLLGETRSDGFTRHSSTLAPSLEAALSKHGVKPSSIGAVAVGLGPGSFTGLRVGVATAGTLAYALGARLAGIPSPAAIAAGCGETGEIVVIQDAKREKLYVAHYRAESGRVRQTRAPFIGTFEEAVKAAGRGAFFTGDAAPGKRAPLEEAGFRAETDPSKTRPSAAWIGRLALEELKAGTNGHAPLAPLYLYPKDCNVTLAKKKK